MRKDIESLLVICPDSPFTIKLVIIQIKGNIGRMSKLTVVSDTLLVYGFGLVPDNDLRWNFQRCGRTEWYVIDDSYAAELHSYISKKGIVGGIYGLIARKCMMISFIIVAAITILKLFKRRGKWNHFQLL